MSAFLKGHGTGTTPLPDHWLAAGSSLLAPGRTGFPRRPRISVGDRLVLVPVLSNAPPLEAIGVAPRSMSQQSHIRIEARHVELALEAIAGVGR